MVWVFAKTKSDKKGKDRFVPILRVLLAHLPFFVYIDVQVMTSTIHI